MGLVDRWWEDQDVATAAGRPRRRLYALNQHGVDALPYTLKGHRALGGNTRRTRTASGVRGGSGGGPDPPLTDGQLCFAAKLTIWKYTVSTFCA